MKNWRSKRRVDFDEFARRYFTTRDSYKTHAQIKQLSTRCKSSSICDKSQIRQFNLKAKKKNSSKKRKSTFKINFARFQFRKFIEIRKLWSFKTLSAIAALLELDQHPILSAESCFSFWRFFVNYCEKRIIIKRTRRGALYRLLNSSVTFAWRLLTFYAIGLTLSTTVAASGPQKWGFWSKI